MTSMKLKIIISAFLMLGIACPLDAQVQFSNEFLDDLKENYNSFNSPIDILLGFAIDILYSQDKDSYPQAERYLKSALAAKTALQDLPNINEQIGKTYALLGYFYEEYSKNNTLALDNYIQSTKYPLVNRRAMYENIVRVAEKINTSAALKRAKPFAQQLQLIEDNERKLNP